METAVGRVMLHAHSIDGSPHNSTQHFLSTSSMFGSQVVRLQLTCQSGICSNAQGMLVDEFDLSLRLLRTSVSGGSALTNF